LICPLPALFRTALTYRPRRVVDASRAL